MKKIQRCLWAKKEIFHSYHDKEWGRYTQSDQEHFELLCLEGAQAGLSWETVLRKREAYRRAFKNFNPKLCAKLSTSYLEQQCKNPGIIRNKLKIGSIVKNARIFLEIQKEMGSFHRYVWSFVQGRQIHKAYRQASDIPSNSAASEALSADLKKRGMSFVGPTIMYAHMQSAGLVNDHVQDCSYWKACCLEKTVQTASQENMRI